MIKLCLTAYLISLIAGIIVFPVFGATDYLVRSPNLTVELSRNGKIVTASYSEEDKNLDPAKLKRMAFHVDWTVGYDLPYMGMFLPPVANDEQKWKRWGGGTTSIRQMAEQVQKLHEMGIYVLNYFNALYFGDSIVYPPPPKENLSASDLWKDPNSFLYTRLENAILHYPRQCKAHLDEYPPRLMKPGDPYM